MDDTTTYTYKEKSIITAIETNEKLLTEVIELCKSADSPTHLEYMLKDLLVSWKTAYHFYEKYHIYNDYN